MTKLSRREAIYRVSLIMGGTISAPALSILSGCQTQVKESITEGGLFTSTQENIIAEISQLIIPTTDTPGAKEAEVPEFVQVMIADCYPEEDQKRFVSGLDQIDQEAKDTYGNSFLELDEAQQIELLTKIEMEAREKRQQDPQYTPPAILMLKELTLIGYFSSEIGATQALSYDPVPGRYNACTTMEPGQKAWAT
ncbi:gluconate 2-dehydrogenase subunit 3 family protein [soil metagenome]